MNPLSTEPGLIVRIEESTMYVKVPVGLGCNACPTKSACTFRGPERAYRTFSVRYEEGCQVGDRVLVHVPGAVLGVTGLVFVALPFVLILSGYGLLSCCVKFPYATLSAWLVGVVLWLSAMYGANAWIEQSARFRERVQPIADLRPDYERIEELTSETHE